GSFAGLLAYPLLVEPNFGLKLQGEIWSYGYGLAVLLTALVASLSWRRHALPAGPVENAPPIAARRRLSWLALAFVPSSLMLGVTTYATRDLTPFPLLWVLPLATYLLTFVAAFAPRAGPERLVRIAWTALPGAATVEARTLATGPPWALSRRFRVHLVRLWAAWLPC